MVLALDTSVLSLAFRRRREGVEDPAPVRMLRTLMAGDWPLLVPGIVLQEILSGVREEAQFERLEFLLRGFTLVLSTREHHTAAARISNQCRAQGVLTSATDCLIAAQAIERGARLFTLDQDFGRMAPVCGLQLFPAR